jgi:Mg2+ and Co2+ transporter CorA
MDAKILTDCKKAIDNTIQQEVGLEQTNAYYDMIDVIARKSLEIRDKLIAEHKEDLENIYESLAQLSIDEIGIPNEDECMKMFHLLDSGIIWNHWVDTLSDVKQYRNKIWRIWTSSLLDYMAVLMNF